MVFRPTCVPIIGEYNGLSQLLLVVIVTDVATPCCSEGTAHQQWLHPGGRLNIICITGAMAVHRLCTTEHPVWTANGQKPIQTSGEGLCS